MVDAPKENDGKAAKLEDYGKAGKIYVFSIALYDRAEKVRHDIYYIMLSYDVLVRLHLHPPSKMCNSLFYESVHNKSHTMSY